MTCLETDQTMIFKTMSDEWHVFKRIRPRYSRPCHMNDMSSNGPDNDIQDHVTWMTCLQTDQTMIFKTMSHEWHVFKRTRPWYSSIQDNVNMNGLDQRRRFCLVFNKKQRLMTFRWKLSLFINYDRMLRRTCTGQAGPHASPGWTEPRFAGRVGPGLESISDIENTTHSLFAKQILFRAEMEPRIKEQVFNQSTKPRPDSVHDRATEAGSTSQETVDKKARPSNTPPPSNCPAEALDASDADFFFISSLLCSNWSEDGRQLCVSDPENPIEWIR